MSNLIHWRISETQIGGFNLQAPEQNTWSNHRVHCSMNTTCGFHLSQTLKNNGCVTYDGDTSYMSRIGYNMIQPVKGNDQKKSTTARKWEIIPILVGGFWLIQWYESWELPLYTYILWDSPNSPPIPKSSPVKLLGFRRCNSDIIHLSETAGKHQKQWIKISGFQVVFDIGGMGLVGFNASLENE